MNKEFSIKEIDNGFIVYARKNSGTTATYVYEFDKDLEETVARQKTMCRMLNDIAMFFRGNPTNAKMLLIAHLEAKVPKVGQVREKKD